MNAQEWARYQKDYFYNKGGYTDAEIEALGEGTDWQSAVLRSTVSHTHNLSISGGDERTRYVVAGNIVHQDGILLNTGYQRNGLRVNIDRHVNSRLTIGATSVVPVYNADGGYNYSNPYEYAYFIMGNIAANPVSDLENSVAQTIDDDVIGNAFANYQLTDDLLAKATFGFDLDNLTQNYFANIQTSR